MRDYKEEESIQLQGLMGLILVKATANHNNKKFEDDGSYDGD